jgi:hypothetical protein
MGLAKVVKQVTDLATVAISHDIVTWKCLSHSLLEDIFDVSVPNLCHLFPNLRFLNISFNIQYFSFIIYRLTRAKGT